MIIKVHYIEHPSNYLDCAHIIPIISIMKLYVKSGMADFFTETKIYD